jgi:hypothetical protein
LVSLHACRPKIVRIANPNRVRQRTAGVLLEGAASMADKALQAKRKFLRFFRKGFADPKYIDWERGYGFDFMYRSRPEWATYTSLLDFAETVRKDVHDLNRAT